MIQTQRIRRRWRRILSGLLLLAILERPQRILFAEENGWSRENAAQKLEEALQEAQRSGSGAVDIVLDEEAERPEVIQAGDLARVAYTVTTADGQLVYTTRASREKNTIPGGHRTDRPASSDDSEELAAGRSAGFPGLGAAVLGMRPGETRRVVVQPEQAFGAYDPGNLRHYPGERRIPRVIAVAAEEYARRMAGLPVAGQEITLVPYFRSRVVDVGAQAVILENLARDGERHEDPIGTTTIRASDTEIVLTLQPKIGAAFQVDGRQGRIVSRDGRGFTVDFNHPLAGKQLILDLEVISLVKSSKIGDIFWVEDYDRAVEMSRKQKRPVFLLLYAEWCEWCGKLMAESLSDPRIRILRDRFIWARIDSDRSPEYAEAFEQKDFPLVVLLTPEGEVVQRIEGYRDATGLKRELEPFL